MRGSGARHAIGELLTCPFCLALAGATISAVTGADWLQLAYERLKQAAER